MAIYLRCIYLQDTRQIPIMANKPMITTTNGIIYVWRASLESSVTKIYKTIFNFVYICMKYI